jgi:ubiquinone/menaquinone biosynthesis C-methylase UbiE
MQRASAAAAGPRFDPLAAAYDRYRIGYAPELYEALEEYGLVAGARVLDVAAGTGLVSAALAERGMRVTGLDVSASMLAFARERAAAATFVSGRAEALPFPDASFDAAVCAQSFHWFDRAAALAEAVRVVRPGGIVAVWWKELMRGDSVRLVRESVSRRLGIPGVKPILAEQFDEFDVCGLTDQTLRVIPWIVPMRVSDYLGYERSRARTADAAGDRLDAYFAALGERLGAPDDVLSLSYLHLLYLGRVTDGAA